MLKAISLLFLLLLLGASPTQAQPGRNMEKEKAIWAELEKSAPKSVDDFKAGTEAMDAGNYDKAAELFLKVHQAAPDFDAALRRRPGAASAHRQVRTISKGRRRIANRRKPDAGDARSRRGEIHFVDSARLESTVQDQPRAAIGCR